MTTLRSFLFIRHGETDWNRSGRFLGRTDVPLNANGKSQAYSAAHFLSSQRVDRIVSSPLSRALDTAKIIEDHIKKPLHIEDRLTECDFGNLEGQVIREVMRSEGISRKEELANILPNDGERWSELKVRSFTPLEWWLRSYPTEIVLFVGHDAILQAISEELCGHWFESDFAIAYRFSPSSAKWLISKLG